MVTDEYFLKKMTSYIALRRIGEVANDVCDMHKKFDSGELKKDGPNLETYRENITALKKYLGDLGDLKVLEL